MPEDCPHSSKSKNHDHQRDSRVGILCVVILWTDWTGRNPYPLPGRLGDLGIRRKPVLLSSTSLRRDYDNVFTPWDTYLFMSDSSRGASLRLLYQHTLTTRMMVGRPL